MPIIFLVCARPGVGINMKIMVPEANIHSLAYFNIEFNYRAMMCVVLSPFCYVQSDNVYGTHTILLCTTRLRVWYSLDFVMYKHNDVPVSPWPSLPTFVAEKVLGQQHTGYARRLLLYL